MYVEKVSPHKNSQVLTARRDITFHSFSLRVFGENIQEKERDTRKCHREGDLFLYFSPQEYNVVLLVHDSRDSSRVQYSWEWGEN